MDSSLKVRTSSAHSIVWPNRPLAGPGRSLGVLAINSRYRWRSHDPREHIRCKVSEDAQRLGVDPHRVWLLLPHYRLQHSNTGSQAAKGTSTSTATRTPTCARERETSFVLKSLGKRHGESGNDHVCGVHEWEGHTPSKPHAVGASQGNVDATLRNGLAVIGAQDNPANITVRYGTRVH